jgi:hypothetical protein
MTLALALLTADLLALLACAVKLHVTMRAGAIADAGAFCNKVHRYCRDCNNEQTLAAVADYATVQEPKSVYENWIISRRYTFNNGEMSYSKQVTERAARRRRAA